MQENKALEFKSALTNQFLKTVSAFANYGTGQILFGVNDHGKICGLDNPQKTALDIENSINDNIRPKPDFSLSINHSTMIVTLTVTEGYSKPYLYRGKAYKRNDTSTTEVDMLELRRLVLEGEQKSFDNLPVSETELSFKRFYKEAAACIPQVPPLPDLLRTLGLSDGKQYNNSAWLLADYNSFPGIDFIQFGEDINTILYREKLEHVSILTLLDTAEENFKRYYIVEEIKGMRRETKERIPYDAFREALANALAHRSWDVEAPIQVSFFKDKIEITSPGSLPSRLNEEEYLYRMISMPRNPVLASVLFRLRIIEAYGTGIQRIRKSYEGSPLQPEFKFSENYIYVTLPATDTRQPIDAGEEKLLRHFDPNRLYTSRELCETTGFSKDKLLSLVNRLVEKSYVQKEGRGRSTKYRLR